MTSETILTIGQKMLEVVVLLSIPLLIPTLIIGLLVGMFQAATQINEMTLSFIPKLVAIVVVLVFLVLGCLTCWSISHANSFYRFLNTLVDANGWNFTYEAFLQWWGNFFGRLFELALSCLSCLYYPPKRFLCGLN